MYIQFTHHIKHNMIVLFGNHVLQQWLIIAVCGAIHMINMQAIKLAGNALTVKTGWLLTDSLNKTNPPPQKHVMSGEWRPKYKVLIHLSKILLHKSRVKIVTFLTANVTLKMKQILVLHLTLSWVPKQRSFSSKVLYFTNQTLTQIEWVGLVCKRTVLSIAYGMAQSISLKYLH